MTKADIQLVRSLEDKRTREEAGLFVAEGEKLVREILASDFAVRKIYTVDSSLTFRNDNIRHPDRARQGDEGSQLISPKEMERASHLKTPTDVLALVEIPRRRLDPATLKNSLTLALDGVQNPGNIGTIIRLADWFGIRDVMCSADCADCWNPKVVQATMGAITRVSVHYGRLESMLSATCIYKWPVFGTFLEGENIYDASLPPEGVIVLGSEGRGISPEIERLVTRKLFIPPFPRENSGSESLNVAVAAAIVCSEFRRR